MTPRNSYYEESARYSLVIRVVMFVCAQHDVHGDATATGRVPHSCRAVPPDVSQVPKSALIGE
eukprot:1471445-Prymnesium_polylepis.1